MSVALGTRLGPYEIVEPIGSGGMGEVYRARDERLGRDVAIKVLPSHTAHDAEALSRFRSEVRAVASLNHPNILAIYDVGAQDDISYAVTELLEGDTLRDRLQRDGPLPPRKALDLAVQFARGLAAAHGSGIVHRDLKPANLFLLADGRLKILDFGLAMREPGSAAASLETRVATQPGVVVGTIGYMAPEQVRGEAATARSDIFSFGLVVYELLRGSNPFLRETMSDTMAAILRDPTEPLEQVEGLPPLAAGLLDRCLEKRPEDRPQSMHDMAFVLAALSSGAATAATSVRGPAVRRAAAWGVAAACVLVILLTLAMAGYVGLSAGRAADAAVAADLSRASTLVARAQQDRLDRLHLHARLVASFPQLKALFEETDPPTIRHFLQSYQQQNPGAPLLVALGPGGYVLAATDDDADAAPEQGPAWLAALVPAGGTGIVDISGRTYHAAVANAQAAGTIFGSVIAAAPVDDAFAQMLRDVTESEAALFDPAGLAGASLRTGQVPWRSLEEFHAAGGGAGAATDARIGPVRYRAWEVPLAAEPPLAAVILASRDDLTVGYRRIQAGLIAIGGAAVLIVLASGWIALRRWRPSTGSVARDSSTGSHRL
jgi:hypothetical protein